MRLPLIVGSLLITLLSALAYAEESAVPRLNTQVTATDAYVHLPLPGKTNTAAFFTLHNSGSDTAILTAVETSIASRAELHSHSHTNGMMRMRKEDQVAIAAQSTVNFAPRSWHVMLFDVQPGLKTGDQLQLILRFADGTMLLVPASARSLFDQPHH